MPFVTGTGLGGATGTPSSMIEAIRAEIDSKMTGVKGTDWIERRYTGSVGGADREYWVELPPTKTFNGRRLIIGFAERSGYSPQSGDSNRLVISTSHLSWTAMTTGTGAGTFLRMDGQPMDKTTGDIDAATIDADVPNVFLLVTGSSSVRHWIITSTDFGIDNPTEELSLYFVIEISQGRFLCLGFAEMVQFGDWSADAQDGDAGHGIMATTISNWADTGLPLTNVHTDNNYFLWGGYDRNVSQSDRDGGSFADTFYIPHSVNLAKYGSLFSPWAVLGSHFPTTRGGLRSYSVEAFGFDHLKRSASVATGIAHRLPVRLYLTDGHTTSPLNIWPVGDVPNVFFVNIGNLNPGATEIFSGDSFLVVPYLEKNQGTINSGNRGYLFKL